MVYWQNFEPTLAKVLCFWTNFHGCKWPSDHVARDLIYQAPPTMTRQTFSAPIQTRIDLKS